MKEDWMDKIKAGAKQRAIALSHYSDEGLVRPEELELPLIAFYHITIPCPRCNNDLKVLRRDLPHLVLEHPKDSCSLAGKRYITNVSEVVLTEVRPEEKEP